MKINFSHIALAVIASSSFSALAAETTKPPVANPAFTEVATAEANITVTSGSSLSLTITPLPDLTVEKVKLGKKTDLAKFKVTGTNVAVRMVNASATDKYCSVLSGTNIVKNKMEVCLKDYSNPIDIGAYKYYRFNEGEHLLRSGSGNVSDYNSAADSYKVTLEAVQLTM
ncbi:hypothetical protein ACE1BG_07690 [Aeromonas veronii]|uniref:hypothetical protein n=1 Tax=Aeromonas veronii TaxID=654 RepID=UPI0035B9F6BA